MIELTLYFKFSDKIIKILSFAWLMVIITLDEAVENEVQSRLSILPPLEKKKAVPKSEPPVRPFIMPVESYREFELLLGAA